MLLKDMPDVEFALVERGSAEWVLMWQELSKHPLNNNLPDPTTAENFGECWQYMDTATYEGELQHCFRHRNHPNNHDLRTYIYIPARRPTLRAVDEGDSAPSQAESTLEDNPIEGADTNSPLRN